MNRSIFHIVLLLLFPALAWGQADSTSTEEDTIAIYRLPFNSEQSDFGGAPLGQGMLYGSERFNSKAGVKYRSSVSGTPLSDLYWVERRDSLRWKRDPKRYSSTLNSVLHEGSAWISPGESTF